MNGYACNNQPRPVAGEITHLAQDGYHPPVAAGNGRYTRGPRWIEARHVFTTACQYDQGTTDQRCAGCEHIKLTGE
jgi:hypothetical protein